MLVATGTLTTTRRSRRWASSASSVHSRSCCTISVVSRCRASSDPLPCRFDTMITPASAERDARPCRSAAQTAPGLGAVPRSQTITGGRKPQSGTREASRRAPRPAQQQHPPLRLGPRRSRAGHTTALPGGGPRNPAGAELPRTEGVQFCATAADECPVQHDEPGDILAATATDGSGAGGSSAAPAGVLAGEPPALPTEPLPAPRVRPLTRRRHVRVPGATAGGVERLAWHGGEVEPESTVAAVSVVPGASLPARAVPRPRPAGADLDALLAGEELGCRPGRHRRDSAAWALLRSVPGWRPSPPARDGDAEPVPTEPVHAEPVPAAGGPPPCGGGPGPPGPGWGGSPVRPAPPGSPPGKGPAWSPPTSPPW